MTVASRFFTTNRNRISAGLFFLMVYLIYEFKSIKIRSDTKTVI